MSAREPWFPSPATLRAEAAEIRAHHPGIGYVATMYDGAAQRIERLERDLRAAFEAGAWFAYKRNGGTIEAGMDAAFSEYANSHSESA